MTVTKWVQKTKNIWLAIQKCGMVSFLQGPDSRRAPKLFCFLTKVYSWTNNSILRYNLLIGRASWIDCPLVACSHTQVWKPLYCITYSFVLVLPTLHRKFPKGTNHRQSEWRIQQNRTCESLVDEPKSKRSVWTEPQISRRGRLHLGVWRRMVTTETQKTGVLQFHTYA